MEHDLYDCCSSESYMHRVVKVMYIDCEFPVARSLYNTVFQSQISDCPDQDLDLEALLDNQPLGSSVEQLYVISRSKPPILYQGILYQT